MSRCCGRLLGSGHRLEFVGGRAVGRGRVREMTRLGTEYRSRTVATQPVDSRIKNTVAIFFLAGAVIYLGPLLINGFFDRYLLTAVVLLGAFVVVTLPVIDRPLIRLRYLAGILLVLGFAGYAIAGTRDYLAWNRSAGKPWPICSGKTFLRNRLTGDLNSTAGISMIRNPMAPAIKAIGGAG